MARAMLSAFQTNPKLKRSFITKLVTHLPLSFYMTYIKVINKSGQKIKPSKH